ncbi:MAG TPA: 23S rRNA (adenine(2503)-C(2))-methyltransferase RlmN [Thermoanaerobaculia bacterium]|jgi:23S rRNA (adenine2503-C2)-methyltransferase|nr:23S rRNA (adenine(2503)-C(2))-methyltransferase RlmN [Thermoanaerobaculia bacterium]
MNTTTIETPIAAEPRAAGRIDVLGLSREHLAAALAPVVDRPFRAGQIYRAIYERAARDFSEMTDLPKELRERLAERFRVGLPEIASRHLSADGTCKYLFRLADGATIEAVDIPDRGRRTLCISSQAGCALACTFCVTGFWGAGRNLSAGEIVGQVLAIRADRGLAMEGLNIVFMGMGEPLLNLENVRPALDLLAEWISPHRITVSTVGILPGLEEMARWERRPNLAISLHAPDEERRGRIMPVNRTYPLAELMAALRRYPLEKGRRLTFEYILIRDLNDSIADADRLSRLLSGLRAKINLIPINPDPVLGESMVPPDDERIEAFKERLRRRGWIATVRRRRGDDVSAACGQLRAFGRDPRGFKHGAR